MQCALQAAGGLNRNPGRAQRGHLYLVFCVEGQKRLRPEIGSKKNKRNFLRNFTPPIWARLLVGVKHPARGSERGRASEFKDNTVARSLESVRHSFWPNSGD